MRVPQFDEAQQYAARPAAAGVTAETTATYTGLRSDLLIPGRGEPITGGALVIKGEKIEWVGRYADRPSEYDNVGFAHFPVLMPGMWDCHTHFGGYGLAFSTFGDSKALLPGAQSLAGAVTVADLKRTLEAGFTSVRELSGVSRTDISHFLTFQIRDPGSPVTILLFLPVLCVWKYFIFNQY